MGGVHYENFFSKEAEEMKAAIYARVSADEQAKKYGIPADGTSRGEVRIR